MKIRYKMQMVFLAIVVLWVAIMSNFAMIDKRENTTAVRTQYIANIDTFSIDNENTPPKSQNAYLGHLTRFKSILEFEFPQPCVKRVVDVEETIEEVVEEIIEETVEISVVPAINETIVTKDEWKPYLATSYSGEVGNRGEDLGNKKAVAMWQSDANYLSYSGMCEEYRQFYSTHNGEEYGALPYGTEIELRAWDGFSQSYKYLGIYTVLDDSPTTQYNFSKIVKDMYCEDSIYHFAYQWSNIDYRGRGVNGGQKYGCITNWKRDYNHNIAGWIDVKDAGWGMVVVEVRIVR